MSGIEIKSVRTIGPVENVQGKILGDENFTSSSYSSGSSIKMMKTAICI